eukprot:CFRG1488T1
MAEDKPKGILKRPSDLSGKDSHGHMRFDEEGIAEIERTKDYGFMKIDEPKTPYHAPEEETNGIVNVPELELEEPEAEEANGDKADWSDDDGNEDAFKKKRAAHYNEFKNVEFARQLLEEEVDE